MTVLADAEISGDLARRAAAFDDGPSVLAVDGTTASPASPSPLPLPPELPADELAFGAVMEEAGAVVVDDHGRLVAEFAGLEVARVTRNLDGVAELEVGVGQADRELQALVHGQLPRRDALVRAIELVAEHRRPGAPMHPLNRLARERWLRSILIHDPSAVGCAELSPVPPLLPRSTLLGMVPTAAIGARDDGTPIVVVCSVGIELDLVADGLDYRNREQAANPPVGDMDLLLVMPRRDVHPVIGAQAARAPRVSITSIDEPWGRSSAAPSAP